MNITSMNRMTLIVLPGMQERRRGLIINISSLSAVAPTPLLTLYAASKVCLEAVATIAAVLLNAQCHHSYVYCGQ